MEGLQALNFGQQPTGEGGDTYRKAAIKIQANFDLISKVMDTKVDAGDSAESLADEIAARIKGDAGTLAAANAYSDAGDAKAAQEANAYADMVSANRLHDAKAHSDAQDAKVTTAVNARMDAGDANVTKAANMRMDAGDVATLKSANDRADFNDANIFASAKAYADAGDAAVTVAANDRMDMSDANTLTAAKTYAESVGSVRLNDAKAYADAQDATVTMEAHAYADGTQTKAVAQAKAYTDDRINALIDGAPDSMNTLKELADALADDSNFAATTTNKLAKKADTTDVDAKDAEILAQAKAYTDNAPAAAVQKPYVDSGDAKALASAKSYADAVASGVLKPSSIESTGTVKGVGTVMSSNGGGSGETSVSLKREGALTDQKVWEILHGGDGAFCIRAVNDTYTATTDLLRATRTTGYAINNASILPNGGRLTVGATADDGVNQLQVSGTVRAANYVINDQSTKASGLVGFNNGTAGPNVAFYGIDTAGAGALTFSTGGNERMRLTAGGALLVGTSAAPAGAGTMQVGGAMSIYSAASDTIGSFSSTAYSGGLSIEAFNGTNATKKNIILNGWGGRVLVGNGASDDGTTTFQVQGAAKISGDLTVARSGGGVRIDDPTAANHSNLYLYRQGAVAWGIRGAWANGDQFQINSYDSTGVVKGAVAIDRTTNTVSALNRLTVGKAVDDGANALQVAGSVRVQAAVLSQGVDAGGANFRMSPPDMTKQRDVMLRNDGENFYLLLADGSGSSVQWTQDRPLTVNMATGAVMVDDTGKGVRMGGDLAVKGDVTARAVSTPSATIETLAAKETVTVTGSGQVGVLMKNTAANFGAGNSFKSFVGPGGYWNVAVVDPSTGGTKPSNIAISGEGTHIALSPSDRSYVMDPRSNITLNGAVSITQRLNLFQGDPMNGSHGEIFLKRVGDGAGMFIRGWDTKNTAGVQFINNAYSDIVCWIDDGGNAAFNGSLNVGTNLVFRNKGQINGDGNVFMTWRGRWLSDDMGKLDDAWNKANDAQVNRADRFAQCHHAEYAEVGRMWRGQHTVDIGDPWVMRGVRCDSWVGPSGDAVGEIYIRLTWLKNN
ncbi:hypothetical protein WT11_01100 [Burkholderia stagnalis]|uniref:hypothetical protein n=1 Tax=Burkholderia stagnalis TaxID=1503054 RepID=UPI0007591059|nr:hypothetical protein [Burkholderia stagnalis]KVN31721.1 hypothetical protein WT11_01100 [Burkholderia stagnalis]